MAFLWTVWEVQKSQWIGKDFPPTTNFSTRIQKWLFLSRLKFTVSCRPATVQGSFPMFVPLKKKNSHKTSHPLLRSSWDSFLPNKIIPKPCPNCVDLLDLNPPAPVLYLFLVVHPPPQVSWMDINLCPCQLIGMLFFFTTNLQDINQSQQKCNQIVFSKRKKPGFIVLQFFVIFCCGVLGVDL